jgi:hypothetical protein
MDYRTSVSPSPQELGFFEEDDEFEDFPAEGEMRVTVFIFFSLRYIRDT